MLPLRICAAALVLVWASTAHPHELWISPEAYVTPNGGKVQAQLRVGQSFSGASYSFNPKRFSRFDLVMNGVVMPVKGRLGDMPALGMVAPSEDGLLIVVHETTDSLLTYTSMEKFAKFARHKDFEWAVERHAERGLPTDRFTERYHRYAKSLIAIGDGTGADQEVGMKTEIIALANPYTSRLGQLPVLVLLDGEPRVNAQVELFEKAPDGTVEVTLHRTDDMGRSTIPVKPDHEYLVDAVTMLELNEGDATEFPVWWTVWASLTFKMPK